MSTYQVSTEMTRIFFYRFPRLVRQVWSSRVVHRGAYEILKCCLCKQPTCLNIMSCVLTIRLFISTSLDYMYVSAIVVAGECVSSVRQSGQCLHTFVARTYEWPSDGDFVPEKMRLHPYAIHNLYTPSAFAGVSHMRFDGPRMHLGGCRELR